MTDTMKLRNTLSTFRAYLISISNKPHTFSISPSYNEGLREYDVDRCILYVDGDNITIALDIEDVNNELHFNIRPITKSKVNRFMYNNRKLD